MLKTVVQHNIFCGKLDVFYFSGFTDEYKDQKNSIYFKYKYFVNINVVTDTFDQFNASLRNTITL